MTQIKVNFFAILLISNFYIINVFANSGKTIDVCDKGQMVRLYAKDWYDSSCSSLSVEDFQDLKNYLKGKNHLQINQDIIEIEENAFDADLFSSIKSIQFLTTKIPGVKSGIKKINKKAFFGLSSLTSLWVNDEDLERIEEGAFEGLPSLERLILSYNKITEIKERTFSGLSSLKHLALHENQISYIEKDAFKGLSSLKSIVLSQNKLQTIDQELFKGLDSLIRIGILDNPLNAIGENTFAPLPSLKIMEIDQDKIQILKKDLHYYGLTEKIELKNHFN